MCLGNDLFSHFMYHFCTSRYGYGYQGRTIVCFLLLFMNKKGHSQYYSYLRGFKQRMMEREDLKLSKYL